MNFFRKPNASELMAQNLEEAQRQLVSYESQAAYANKMAEYYQGEVTRLKSQLKIKKPEAATA